jgi:hypothetical protein
MAVVIINYRNLKRYNKKMSGTCIIIILFNFSPPPDLWANNKPTYIYIYVYFHSILIPNT